MLTVVNLWGVQVGEGESMSFGSDLNRSIVQPVVLQLLRERPMYGYEIIRIVQERTRDVLQWRQGTLYPCLHRLERAGLIRGEFRRTTTGREGKFYAITRKGTALLKKRLVQWTCFATSVNFLLPRAR